MPLAILSVANMITDIFIPSDCRQISANDYTAHFVHCKKKFQQGNIFCVYIY
jgi:hypothetical protein